MSEKEQANHPETEMLHSIRYDSPLGNLIITGSDKGIVSVLFTDDLEGEQSSGDVLPGMQECIRQLDEYFAGKRRTFSLDFDLRGTEFQKKVWMELLNIPFGKTISYLGLARRLAMRK
jgi:methylated-DNA-[protein]-cysteine S-methyltransferase